jgi:hypothetical protein
MAELAALYRSMPALVFSSLLVIGLLATVLLFAHTNAYARRRRRLLLQAAVHGQRGARHKRRPHHADRKGTP